MIRRRVGDSFYLFAQDDHARWCGELVRHYGNASFTRPEPMEQTIAAVALHDCGWPMHDRRPTLNKEGLPLHVFETPLKIALEVWRAGVEATGAEDAYTQLLVSLHVMGLSGFASRNVHDRMEMFELNKFQQRQIEKQVELRQKLGMKIDIALKLGLAVRMDLEQEEKLRRNYFILQTMDRISLGLCCQEVVFTEIDGIVPRIGANPLTLHFARTGDWAMRAEPWPFAQPRIEIEMPYRQLPARKYENDEEFRAIYERAETKRVMMSVHS